MQRGDRLSVQAELVNAPAEHQLWGERFNRTTSDIFKVEDEIARQIADRLRVQLSREDKTHMARRSTEDSEAYRLYLKARFHWRQAIIGRSETGDPVFGTGHCQSAAKQ